MEKGPPEAPGNGIVKKNQTTSVRARLELDIQPRDLIDRYPRRMVIENTIADAIDFFHMDALSAVVPMKVDVDVQLTVMALTLYRILARRIGHRCENRKPAQLFRKFVNAGATVEITEREIIVSYGRRACDRSWPMQDCSRRPKGCRGSRDGHCASGPSEQGGLPRRRRSTSPGEQGGSSRHDM